MTPGSPVGGGIPGGRRAGGALEQRLVVLMGARLALSALSFAIALLLDVTGGAFANPVERGFYAIVAFAFLATVAYGAALPRIRWPRMFAALNLGTDLVIVTALVSFSGGGDSVFLFLFVLVAMYGGVLFDLRGALLAACVGSLAYGCVLVAGDLGWVATHRPDMPSHVELLTSWGVQAGALVLVAALGSVLFAELRRTGAALDERTTDLRRLRSLHERTVESLMSGLLTTNREGSVTSFNPEAERITGLCAMSVVGRPLDEVLPDVARELIPASSGSSELRVRARLPHRNARGEDLHLGAAAYFLREVDGRPAGHIVIFQDVTDVVQMEAELRRNERLAAIGELAASIAHEVRNPLAAISGSIQVLRRSGRESGDEARRLMEIVIRETDRLNVLIGDFLRYARPAPLQLESIAVREVLDDVLKVFDGACPEGVTVESDIPAELCVRADAAQVYQVLWNLVLNGAQAMPEGGRLEISARPCGTPASQGAANTGRNAVREAARAGVEISVRDHGTGIPPEVFDRIFDPFFTTKRSGSGLGLATVHRIVEDHGGSIHVENSAGGGTTIRLRLQRAGEAA